MWERRVAYIVGFIVGFIAAFSLVSIIELRYTYMPGPMGGVYKIDRLYGDTYLIFGNSISKVEEEK